MIHRFKLGQKVRVKSTCKLFEGLQAAPAPSNIAGQFGTVTTLLPPPRNCRGLNQSAPFYVLDITNGIPISECVLLPYDPPGDQSFETLLEALRAESEA